VRVFCLCICNSEIWHAKFKTNRLRQCMCIYELVFVLDETLCIVMTRFAQYSTCVYFHVFMYLSVCKCACVHAICISMYVNTHV
jgi:hypothetical protein